VVGPESQGGQIPELTGQMQWPSGVPEALTTNLRGQRRSSDNQGSSWERRRQAWEATRIAVEQSGKNDIFFGNAVGAPENRSYYSSLNDFKTHVFRLYSHLSIYVSMYLCSYPSTHGLYLDWLQVVLERNRRCASRWRWND
jgi:hypothetical protein